MNKLISFLFFCLTSFQLFGQMIMSAEGIHPDNVCKQNTVYFLIEKKARPLESIDSIEMRLNKALSFARQDPGFEANCAIQLVVNCKGELGGGFHVVKKSGDDNIDNELIDFFKTIKAWKPGMIKKKAVDSWYMWRLEIKNGYIDITNI